MEQLKVKVLLQHQGDQVNVCFLNIRRLSHTQLEEFWHRGLTSMQEMEKSSLENLTNPRRTKDINMGTALKKLSKITMS